MKNIDLNKKEDLLKIQETLNKIIAKKIDESEVKSAIANVSNYSLFTVKGIFENISDKLWNSKEGKKVIKSYIKTIKEDKNLKNMYNVHESLRNFKFTSNPDLFLEEAISLARENNNMKSLANLQNVLQEGLRVLNFSSEQLKEIMVDKNQIFNESLDYIINNPKSTKTLNEYVENLSSVKQYLSENMQEKKEIVESSSLKQLMKDFETTINECENKWEAEAIADIAYYDIAGKNKEGLFEEYKTRCLNILSERIENEDNMEQKIRFTTMKEGVEKKMYESLEINENILKFANLINVLSE